MRWNQGSARSGLLAVAAATLVALPGLAAAESYARFSYDTGTTKDETPAKGSFPATTDKYKDTGYALDLRWDLGRSPLFITLGGSQLESKLKDIEPDEYREKLTGYNAGMGFAFVSTPKLEVYARAAYDHERLKAEFVDAAFPANSSTFCCGTVDSGTLAVGGYDWLSSFVKVYGEVEFTKSSHHAHDYGANVGFEFPIAAGLRLFAEGAYRMRSAYEDDITTSTVGGGIKYAWGGKKAARKKVAAAPAAVEEVGAPAADAGPAAPAEAATAPAESAAAPTTAVTAPVAAAAPTPVAADPAAGSTARLNDGVQFRTQPKAEAAILPTDGAEPVTLKTQIINTDGKWWYVSNSKGAGWVKQSEFTVP